MKADSILKLKTQATLTTLNFCEGLLGGDDEEDDGEDHSSLIDKYWIQILQVLRGNLNQAITEKYEPLQFQSLNLISTMADVIGTKFELCFNDFVTPLKTAIGIPQPTEHTVADTDL